VEDSQHPRTPSSRQCHADDKHQGYNSPGRRAFAPALEHGYGSSEKQTNRDHGEDLHEATPVITRTLFGTVMNVA